MNFKNILIGAGVGSVLALVLHTYNKNKKSKEDAEKSAGGGMGTEEEESGMPQGGGMGSGGAPSFMPLPQPIPISDEDAKKLSAIAKGTPTTISSEQASADSSLSSNATIGTASNEGDSTAEKINAGSVTLQPKTSGFDGGSNYIEVGDLLTDV